MKSKILKITLLLSLCFSLFLSVTVYGLSVEHKDSTGKIVKLNDFLDTKGHWAHNQILKWGDYGVIYGNNGYFMPNNNITRGDLCIMIDRMLGLKNTTYNYFTDLNSNDYFRESVMRCVAEGYINGTGNNLVNPRGYATREEVATILCRIFNIDVSYTGSTRFVDDYMIGAWAKPSVSALSRLGYMNGTTDNKAMPKAYITRAEMITLLNNIADTYIVKKDIDGSGTSFKGTYPRNVVTSRNVEFTNTTIGRDLYLTQSTSTVTLTNSVVRGRLVAMTRSNITLKNTEIEQVYLKDGKSTVSGITDKINEIYVSNYASESTLDAIPNKLILEPGVRVRVDSIMYENTTSRNKIYYGQDLKADISDEQGYVVGGPKVSNVKYTVDNSNYLVLKDIKITAGENTIREIGVIWLENDEDEDTVNPTYKKNDGKEPYGGRYTEPFTFEVGKISGYKTYRVYVRDSEGLYAYSQPFTIKAYTYSIDLKVSDISYPEKFQVDVEFKGTNVPDIRNIHVVYDIDELYSENHNKVSLRKYEENYAENPVDPSRYKRYTGTITASNRRDPVTGEYVYDRHTAFGYIIEFTDGSIINRFPVLTDTIPSGVNPVNSLTLGNITYSGDNKILLNNNKLSTGFVSVQEVGIVYRESKSDDVSKPSENANGWTRISCETNIDKQENIQFNTSITIHDYDAKTFIAPYVRTSNGYYYGSVSKVENNWKGDEGGPRITGTPNVYMLGDNDAVITFPMTNQKNLDLNYACFEQVRENGSTVNNLKTLTLNDLDFYYNELNSLYYIHISDLKENTVYNIDFRLKNMDDLSSNLISLNINTKNLIAVSLGNKIVGSNGVVKYTIFVNNTNNEKIVLNSSGHYFINQNTVKVSESDGYLILDSDTAKGKEIVLNFKYKILNGSISKDYTFERSFILP